MLNILNFSIDLMVCNFTSLQFLTRFLPILLVIYYVVPKEKQQWVLLAGSIVFYSFGEPLFVLLLLLNIGLNYWAAVKNWESDTPNRDKGWIVKKRKKRLELIVVYDLTILVIFKMLATFVDSGLLPLGLSFYIFRMISFQVDVYRNEMRRKPQFRETALYFSLFPQITQGPIMRYFDGRFYENHNFDWGYVEEGLKIFIPGLAMKVLLADRLAILWKDLNMIGFQSISTPLAWLGAVGYSLQLYFDFWGYSLMSAGILMMFGYDFIENFDHPYSALSISDFYRRWHMTLGAFFRDYVYIPLGGSKCSKNRMVFNLAIVWLLTGFWHGNGFNFLIWGAVLGILIIGEKLLYGEKLKEKPVLGHLYVIILIPLTWVVFAVPNLGDLGLYFARLFPVVPNGVAVNKGDIIKYALDYWPYFTAGIALCVPAVAKFFQKKKDHPVVVGLCIALLWMCLYFVSISAGNPFMYLNF